MIWIWLALAVMPTLGVLAIGWLLVGRWWRRREARKHIEALARQAATHLAESVRPVGAAILTALVPLATVLNEVDTPVFAALAAEYGAASSGVSS
jgi:hypothetical protein